MNTPTRIAFRSEASDPFVGELFVADPPDSVTSITWYYQGAPITDGIAHVDAAGAVLRFNRLNRLDAGAYRADVHHDGTVTSLDYTLSFRNEAVLVVHGIGEHVALDFAHTYTNALARTWDEIDEDIFEVPDTDIKTRRFRIGWRPPSVRPTDEGGALYYTDVYEHYWQPHVRDSQLRHFVGFLRNRLFSPASLPRRLHDVVVQLVVMLSVVIVALFASDIGWGRRLAFIGAYALLAWAMAAARAWRQWVALALTAVVGSSAGAVAAWITTRADSGLLARPDILASSVIAVTGLVAALATSPLRTSTHSGAFRLWMDDPEPKWAPWFLFHAFLTIGAAVAVAALAGLGPHFDSFLLPFADGVDASARMASAVPWLVALLLGAALAGLSRKVAIWGLAITVAAALFASAAQLATVEAGSQVLDNPIAQAVIVLLASTVLGWLVMHFGDVLRYVDPSPDNHHLRNQLADSGVELLQRLHGTPIAGEDPPDRIVVVGHSMGTQVAYDVLLRYWQQVNLHLAGSLEDSDADEARLDLEDRMIDLYKAVLANPRQCEPVLLARADDAALPDVDPFAERAAYRTAQRSVLPTLNDDHWGGERSATGRWLVSDFVTLATPLTHAPYIYPSLGKDFASRRLATCPPQLQPTLSFLRWELDDADVYHQAALFAVTRWTNLYYANDVVGGPVAGVFGPGVWDVRLEDQRGLSSVFPVNHSHYPRDPRVQGILRQILEPQLAQPAFPAEHLLAAARAKAAERFAAYAPDDATAAWWTGARLERAARTDRFLSSYSDGDQGALFDQDAADAGLDRRTQLVPESVANEE